MELTFGHCIIYAGLVFLILGIWQLVRYKLIRYTYSIGKNDNESLYSFCCRTYKSIYWVIVKKINLRWYYDTVAFLIFSILKSIILLLISVAIFIGYFALHSSDLSGYLQIKF